MNVDLNRVRTVLDVLSSKIIEEIELSDPQMENDDNRENSNYENHWNENYDENANWNGNYDNWNENYLENNQENGNDEVKHGIYVTEKEGDVIYRVFRYGRQLALSVVSHYENQNVAAYQSQNHWFTPSPTMEQDTIHVKWLESKRRGMGSLLLAYSVLDMKLDYPYVYYSTLDDDSDYSTHIVYNIYSRFGYSPVEAVVQNGENTVRLSGPEKQVEISDFLDNVQHMYSIQTHRRNPRRGRRGTRGGRGKSRRRGKSCKSRS